MGKENAGWRKWGFTLNRLLSNHRSEERAACDPLSLFEASIECRTGWAASRTDFCGHGKNGVEAKRCAFLEALVRVIARIEERNE